jgi:hypothetical protein
MRWRKIDRASRIQNKGVYTDWKDQISKDCYEQCVYCSINEGPWGGIDHYHIDHFKPQSKFEHLTHVITNLYHCCPICNKFKLDDWPNDCDNLDVVCYPDPSDHNYCDIFEISPSNYNIKGKYVAAEYVVNRLYLNRPQLVYERREYFLTTRAMELITEAKSVLEVAIDNDSVNKKDLLNLSAVMLKMNQHLLIRNEIPPYKLMEIKKPKKK